MKTYKHLYPALTDFDALYAAWRRARRGKRYKANIQRPQGNWMFGLAPI
jgi:hypothetical protein